MLQLSRTAPVAFHGQMSLMEWTLEPGDPGQWIMHIEVNNAEEPEPTHLVSHDFVLTDAQASATLALMVNELTEEGLNSQLYAIAEQAWAGVEPHFRPIP